MALGFFRKRQKMIFVIMVVLMVSFLIGFQGFNMIFSGDPGDRTVARAGDTEITPRMINQATSDLELLGYFIGGFGERSQQAAVFRGILGGAQGGSNAPLRFLLLQIEAEQNDIDVEDFEVDRMIETLRQRGMNYDAVVNSLRDEQKVPEDRIREAFKSWLLVYNGFRAGSAGVLPSRTELEETFRDLQEQLDLTVVRYPAEDYLPQVDEPTDEQLREHFEAYRDRPPRRAIDVEDFPFGYIRPPMADVQYLLFNTTAIRRGAVPDEQVILDYYNDHMDEFVRQVPESEGEDQADEDGVVRPELMKEVQLTAAQARPIIIDKLRDSVAKAKRAEINARLQREIQDANEAHPEHPEEIYPVVVEKMTLSGDHILGRKIPRIELDRVSLREAVKQIGTLAVPSVQAIVFPFGPQEGVDISPNLEVSLSGRELTVGEALGKLASQIPNLPEIRWGVLDGMPNVLYATGGVEFFPLRVGRTGLKTATQIDEISVLQDAYIPGDGKSLGRAAVDASLGSGRGGKLEVGQESPVSATVSGDDIQGSLYWRVLEAQPASQPEEMTDDIREQVVEDLKLARAFEIAKSEAEKVTTLEDFEQVVSQLEPEEQEPAEEAIDAGNEQDDEDDAEEAGEEADSEESDETDRLVQTGLFARKNVNQQILQFYGITIIEPSAVPGLRLRRPAHNYLRDKVFEKLTPEDLSAPYDPASDEVLTVAMPGELLAVVARRSDYRPALLEDFNEYGSSEMTGYWYSQNVQQAFSEWFNLDNIMLRVNFTQELED